MLGWGEKQLGYHIYRRSVKLLGERGVHILAPQPCFNVKYGYFQIECRKCCGKGGGGISMDENSVGRIVFKDRG